MLTANDLNRAFGSGAIVWEWLGERWGYWFSNQFGRFEARMVAIYTSGYKSKDRGRTTFVRWIVKDNLGRYWWGTQAARKASDPAVNQVSIKLRLYKTHLWSTSYAQKVWDRLEPGKS